MQENNQKMTIEDLAAITKQGFDDVDKRFGGIEGRFGGIEGRFDRLEAKVNSLPDKAYLDDKLADLEGAVIVRQRKGDQKINLLVDFLHKKKILEEEEIKMLNEIQVFPRMEMPK